ncbi:MAG: hypothetical protein K0U72_10000 [Gammaproteobacteria bacterium]|nr:hypothetical protein [Gammaproteobacteria bacterium]
MVKYLTVMLATLIVGCAAKDTKEPNVVEENDAIRDYIEVAKLPEKEDIRYRMSTHLERITDRYAILNDRKSHWLIEFRRLCHELRDSGRIKADIRRDSHIIRARIDTLRGCHIDSIYEVSEAQAEELKALGE